MCCAQVYNDADSRDTDGVEMTSVSASPVADRSLLGSAASRLCQGAPLHWEHPICPATHKTGILYTITSVCVRDTVGLKAFDEMVMRCQYLIDRV